LILRGFHAAAMACSRVHRNMVAANRQCGLVAAKVLIQQGGVIRFEMTRHPVLPIHPVTRAGLIETARRTDPLVLRLSK
jgi:2-keto-3-deoxy-L-arabinonate dehydratase